METSWRHADVFPIIAKIIKAKHQIHHGFVTTPEIAAQLLEDREARPLIDEAHEKQGGAHSLEEIAANMVAWFSARITGEKSDWADSFHRTEIDGHWAYMPIEEYQITPQKVDELLRFLPLFEGPEKKFTKEWKKTRLEDGWLHLPYPVYTDEVQEFFRLASKPCWCDFGYDGNETSKMLADDEFIRLASLSEIKTMLTYCVRGERFCDGHWEQVLKSGRVVVLLKRLKELRRAMP